MEDAPTPDPELIREKAFLTESLARLYVKQHKFEQALAIFSRLNLQYSKKSNNFADQIRYLNKIIEFEKETDLTSKSLK
jgi:thioredoxin-like negative regulator of GroEL